MQLKHIDFWKKYRIAICDNDKHGGVLSPILFYNYMDNVSIRYNTITLATKISTSNNEVEISCFTDGFDKSNYVMIK